MGVSLRLPEKKKGALWECKTGLPLWLCPAVYEATCMNEHVLMNFYVFLVLYGGTVIE